MKHSLLCLGCGYPCERATGVNTENRPHPGAMAICIACGHLMAFNDNMQFRELTPEERAEAMQDKKIAAVSIAILDKFAKR